MYGNIYALIPHLLSDELSSDFTQNRDSIFIIRKKKLSFNNAINRGRAIAILFMYA